MYRQPKLRADEMCAAADDILTWFRKHEGSDVAAKDVQLFAVPYASLVDTVIILNRLVREGSIKRTLHEPTMFTVNASYSLNK